MINLFITSRISISTLAAFLQSLVITPDHCLDSEAWENFEIPFGRPNIPQGKMRFRDTPGTGISLLYSNDGTCKALSQIVKISVIGKDTKEKTNTLWFRLLPLTKNMFVVKMV